MWDPYAHIWEVDKEAFLAKYLEEKHKAIEFDNLIITYTDLANTVQVQETVNQVNNIKYQNVFIIAMLIVRLLLNVLILKL